VHAQNSLLVNEPNNELLGLSKRFAAQPPDAPANTAAVLDVALNDPRGHFLQHSNDLGLFQPGPNDGQLPGSHFLGAGLLKVVVHLQRLPLLAACLIIQDQLFLLAVRDQQSEDTLYLLDDKFSESGIGI